MSDEPDLMAELDAAEAIVMHGATVETQWGVRYGTEGRVAVYGSRRASESLARMDAAGDPGTVVRRTVTYGPWGEVPQ